MSKPMSSRERLLAAYARSEVDRVPVSPHLIRWIRGRHGCTSPLQQLATAESFGFDPVIYYGAYYDNPLVNDYVYRPDGLDAYRDLPGIHVEVRTENYSDRTVHVRRFETAAGVLTDRMVWPRPGVGYGDGPNPHREEPLVKSLADVPALKCLFPAVRKGMLQNLRLFTEIVGDRGLVEFMETTCAGGWGLECLGTENMLLCAVQDKELLKAVLRACQDQHLRVLKAVLESGHRHIVVSWFQASASTGWSPAHVEEFFMPLIRESVDFVKSYDATYRFQDDGKMAALVPRLVELRVDAVGGLQPPPVGDCDIAEIKRRWGDRICLCGGLDPIYTFERGTPQTVRAEVWKLLAAAGPRGLVVGTAEAFGPETPDANLHALAQAVREFGKPS